MKRKNYIRNKKRKIRMRRSFTILLASLTALTVGFIALQIYVQIAGAPPVTVPKASIFLDADEKQIGDHFTNERRYWVTLDEISPYLIDASISVEDQDFYTHSGLNFKRIGGALLADIKARSKVQGASTITQQYARNLYLTHEKSWTRKANEALYAYRLEAFYDKDDILEGYLNTVYYGHGMYGVEAASRFYFGKAAKNLTLSEAAMLAGIPKGPSIYSPIVNLEKASNRQHLILQLMKEQQYISEVEQTRAKEEAIVLKNEAWLATKSIAPYFLDVAWQEASELLEAQDLTISEGGWTIQTTLNQAHQQAAEQAVKKEMPNSDLQVAFLSMEAGTGGITALVGGRDYAASPFNRVTQAKRQPGSTIKPILYAAALEKGYTPLTFLNVQETIFTYDSGRREYKPKNVNGEFATSDMSMAQAMAISDNIYAVKTLESIGYSAFREMANRFNLSASKENNPSVALGTTETTLFDMTNAYNMMASNGLKTKPTTILSIKDADGNIVYKHQQLKKERVLSSANAFILSQMMTGMFDPVFNSYSPSTGLSIRSHMTHTYAAKSGTTNSDQWLVGYTPSLTAGVWNGYDQGKTLEVKEDMAATKQIWIQFMETVNSGKKNETFKKPKNVRAALVDIETGKLATDACPKQRLIYMKSEDIPTEKCEKFDIFDTNTWDELFNGSNYQLFQDTLTQ